MSETATGHSFVGAFVSSAGGEATCSRCGTMRRTRSGGGRARWSFAWSRTEYAVGGQPPETRVWGDADPGCRP